MEKNKPFCIALLLFFLSMSYLVNYAVAVELIKTPTPPSNLIIDSAPPPPLPLPVEPPLGNDSLLSGKTPENFTLPSGWSLVRTQGFESGSLPGDEGASGSFTTVNKHSGSYAYRGYQSGTGTAIEWNLDPSSLGSFQEVYVSYWEYVEPQGRANEEIHLFRHERRDGGGLIQQIAVMGFAGWNETTIATNIAQINECGNEGIPLGCTYNTFWSPGVKWSIGEWVQWEFHYRPNTPGQSNGFSQVYRNGVKVTGGSGNLNGNIIMSGYLRVSVAGWYSKFVEWTDESKTTCSKSAFSGWQEGGVSDYSVQCSPCPNQCPPNGYVPKFYRYIDDIIVMKR